MFKELETAEQGAVRVAALSHDQMVRDAEGASAADAVNGPSVVERWKLGIERWCQKVEIAPDLAENIGSRRWFRGFATMLGLSAAAFACWPDFSAVEAATTRPIADRSRDEFRSQTISPLAFGADSGRHMGASPLVRPLANVPERPSIQLVSTLGQGDSFPRMLERVGVGSADASRIAGLVAQAVPVDDLSSGTRFDITMGRRPSPEAPRAIESLNFRARFDLDLSIERGPGGNLSLIRRPIRVDETPLRIRGKVGSSLYRSARNAGAPVGAIQDYLRAIDKYLSLESDIAAQDEFDIVVGYKRSAKGEREVGNLLYAGLEHGGKPRVQLLRWGKAGEMIASSALTQARGAPGGTPVAGRMTSPYGKRRHPLLGFVRMHAGIDYGARYGSPIYAVADGVVNFAGRHGGHGNYVRLQHGGGLDTGYGHMSRIAVSRGTRVRAGQVIGYVGSTGLSTGPHLHFEAYRGGRTINPAGLRFIARPQIDGKEKDAYRARLKAMQGVEPGAAFAAIAAPVEAPVDTRREIDRLAPAGE